MPLIYLHECGVEEEGDAAAVDELVKQRARVCRCEWVGECLFGQEWWEDPETWAWRLWARGGGRGEGAGKEERVVCLVK